MKSAVQSIAGDFTARPGKWRVDLRDKKTGRILPVIVHEADAEYRAISSAMNRAKRFFPGLEFEAVTACKTL